MFSSEADNKAYNHEHHEHHDHQEHHDHHDLRDEVMGIYSKYGKSIMIIMSIMGIMIIMSIMSIMIIMSMVMRKWGYILIMEICSFHTENISPFPHHDAHDSTEFRQAYAYAYAVWAAWLGCNGFTDPSPVSSPATSRRAHLGESNVGLSLGLGHGKKTRSSGLLTIHHCHLIFKGETTSQTKGPVFTTPVVK